MDNAIKLLNWNDSNIPHKFWTEKRGESTRICLKIIKDSTPELLTLDVDCDDSLVHGTWQGQATAISPVYDNGQLFSQIRELLSLECGSVIWTVTHIKMPDGKVMSADKLAFYPGEMIKLAC